MGYSTTNFLENVEIRGDREVSIQNNIKYFHVWSIEVNLEMEKDDMRCSIVKVGTNLTELQDEKIVSIASDWHVISKC